MTHSTITLEELPQPTEVGSVKYTHKAYGVPGHEYWVFCKPKYEENVLKMIIHNPTTNKSNKIEHKGA